MQSDYAQTLHSFANDLDNLWRDKGPSNNDFGTALQSEESCTLNRFLLSATHKYSANLQSRILPMEMTDRMNLVDRLAKSASVWTRPELSRQEAEKILMDYDNGIFIVRMNTGQKTMVLTYKMPEKVQHVLIKVDVKKGFYMDGSSNVFRNVNLMIAHYMRHGIQSPDLVLKLPKALLEASEPDHFKFFENMKADFWKTAISRKGVNEIWGSKTRQTPASSGVKDTKNGSSNGPPLPPRGYENMDLTFIQGLADVDCPGPVLNPEPVDEYQKIVKLPKKPMLPDPTNVLQKSRSFIEPHYSGKVSEKSLETGSGAGAPIYSAIWNYSSRPSHSAEIPEQRPSDVAQKVISQALPRQKDLEDQRGSTTKLNHNTNLWQSKNPNGQPSPPAVLQPHCQQNLSKLQSLQKQRSDEPLSSIPGLVKHYFPELIDEKYVLPDQFASRPSLQKELLEKRTIIGPESSKPETTNKQAPVLAAAPVKEPVYQTSAYATPWDLKNTWITQLLDMDPGKMKVEGPGLLLEPMSEAAKAATMPVHFTRPLLVDDNGEEDQSSDNDTSSGCVLQQELLAELRPVILSTEWENAYSTQDVAHYGNSIRTFIERICLRSDNRDSSMYSSIQMFIQCTMDRSDLSPYTTMRLIRQYMSGLKNHIIHQKDTSTISATFKDPNSLNNPEITLTDVLNKERKNTPKNVFINLDSILESVLTRSVLKPLTNHVYRLLILEHYKNNNLKLISDGVQVACSLTPEMLGLKNEAVEVIRSRLSEIKERFGKLANSYSPERKICHLVALVEIVMNLMTTIYPDKNFNVIRTTMKTDSILPIFVYIFSQCRLDSISAQCEVEFIEGLVWSPRLANGEPGFFLLNLMSALEAIKVLGRPLLSNWSGAGQQGPLNMEPRLVDNSTFFTPVNAATLSTAAVGSVNVIILDEKINRLVTRTFPVRSTVNVRCLCNTIAHRLGIFNPMDYCLLKFTGFEEIQLQDHEFPLLVKQEYQQKTGETLHFLFKRHKALFILPSNVIDN